MTAMEAYITADILLTTRGPDGAEARASDLLRQAEGVGDVSVAKEWADVRRALGNIRAAN